MHRLRAPETLRLELLAVHVGGRLDSGPRRQIRKLRATVLVRFLGQHLRTDVKFDLVIRDVVRQRTADQPDRDRAFRKIVHRPRNAGHLFRIRHREAALLSQYQRRLTTKDTKDTKGQNCTDEQGRSVIRRPITCESFVSIVVNQCAASD